jgi:hypothetical protein
VSGAQEALKIKGLLKLPSKSAENIDHINQPLTTAELRMAGGRTPRRVLMRRNTNFVHNRGLSSEIFLPFCAKEPFGFPKRGETG